VSRGRFGVLLAVIVAVLTIASFVGVYAVLDDGPDTPSGAGSNTTLSPSSSSTSTTSTTMPGALVTPTFVVVVSSEGDEGSAQAIRDELTEGGYASGVLHSDDYSSLDAGFWVAYVGPFDDVAAANTTRDELAADGYTEAYPRCVGTDADC
jgi:hypothetical protein